MSSPKRIQRKRTKGWRMPEDAVYVGRPARWGNPYIVHTPEIVMHPESGRDWWCPDDGARRVAADMYREMLQGKGPAAAAVRAAARTELRGLDLACWCPLTDAAGNPVPCHADVLLEIANEGSP